MPNFLCPECFWEDNDPRQLSVIPCPRCGAAAERLDLPATEEDQTEENQTDDDQVERRPKFDEEPFGDHRENFDEDFE